MTPILSSPNEVQYFLPQGKPDPYAPFIQGSEDLRPRITQKPQKGMITCVYYALNTLRTRYGKRCPDPLQEGRAFEIVFSQRRKKITALDSAYYLTYKEGQKAHAIAIPSLLKLIHNGSYTAGMQVSTKQEAEKALESLGRTLQEFSHEKGFASIIRQEACKALKVFIEDPSPQNLEEYTSFQETRYARALIDIEWEFLAKLKKDPQRQFQEHLLSLKTFYGRPLILPWQIDTLPITIKAILLQSFSHLTAFEKLRLTPSTFTPLTPIKDCIAILKEKGPMAVIGFFGQAYYGAPPTKMDKIQERDVWGWKKTDPFSTADKTTHMVVVSGAKITTEGRAFIFYIDPSEGSDPLDESKQKIYITRYESFAARLHNIANLKSYMGTFPYALHRPLDDLPLA